MGKINVKEWHEFLIGDFFDAFLSSDDIQPKNIVDGETPLVSSGKENNGIVAYIEDKNAKKWPGNTITVDMFGKAFYQEKAYHCVSHGRVNILIPKFEINGYAQQFIATVIQSVSSKKYEFKEMCTGKKLLQNTIKLPVDETGYPDLLYMESYMKKLELAVGSSLTDLQLAKKFGVSGKIDMSRWKLFQISDLFNVQKGKRLTKADMKDGKIRFIGASAINNGITAYISNDEHLHPQNTITLSYNGSIGEAFYQDEIFWASDDVNVLYPKFEMNRDIAFFIIPLLKTVGKRYAFIDKWKKEDMEKSRIPLPSDKDGNPDYKYMEKYIATELNITENALNKLMVCV